MRKTRTRPPRGPWSSSVSRSPAMPRTLALGIATSHQVLAAAAADTARGCAVVGDVAGNRGVLERHRPGGDVDAAPVDACGVVADRAVGQRHADTAGEDASPKPAGAVAADRAVGHRQHAIEVVE